MRDTAYRVVVTREDGAWLADVPDLEGAHTFAPSLPGLDRGVREAIALAAALPDEAMPSPQLRYGFRTDSDVDTANPGSTSSDQGD